MYFAAQSNNNLRQSRLQLWKYNAKDISQYILYQSVLRYSVEVCVVSDSISPRLDENLGFLAL